MSDPATGAPTLGVLYRQARDRLRAGGIEGADLDARLLASTAFDLSPERLFLHADEAADPEAARRLDAFVARRLAHEPVGRILGRRDFWDMTLLLSEATLEPRPDTEILIEAVLDAIDRQGGRERNWAIADIGTGTGAILLALLRELPQARGIGIDIALSALETARCNAARAGVSDRVAFVRGHYCDALGPAFDLVVSNPPYIASADIEDLSPEVRRYDPRLALDGGPDGLDAYRALAAAARGVLLPKGRLFVEIGAEQAGDVGTILEASGLVVEEVRQDLARRDRVLSARPV